MTLLIKTGLMMMVGIIFVHIIEISSPVIKYTTPVIESNERFVVPYIVQNFAYPK